MKRSEAKLEQCKKSIAEHRDLVEVVEKIKHYLPSQAVLKDFVHHNTLHAFQNLNFHEGIMKSEKIFGYKVYLQLDEFRTLYRKNKISKLLLLDEIKKNNLEDSFLDQMLLSDFRSASEKRIGGLRSEWKKEYALDLNRQVHPILFRYLCNFLDQGISEIHFPYTDVNFFEAMKRIDRDSFGTVFLQKAGRARRLFHQNHLSISDLLELLVEDQTLFETYLFDQQFAHSGWSGLVAMIENTPEMLIEKRRISLNDIIKFELLLEIDHLDTYIGVDHWKKIGAKSGSFHRDILSSATTEPLDLVLKIFQNAFERTYYEQVLQSLKTNLADSPKKKTEAPSYQALFCIDDRECSLRRYIESADPNFETYGTPGFFGFEFYFQPIDTHNLTKQCPAPVTPKYLVKEIGLKKAASKDYFLRPNEDSFLRNWVMTQGLGYWSAIKLFLNIFRPTSMPATTTSLNHMDTAAELTIAHSKQVSNLSGGLSPAVDMPFENTMHAGASKAVYKNLQLGFTVEEMVERVYNVLKSIGLEKNFSPIVYVIGHGASSVNNPHYSAYDCGACSGRPGSVNARVLAYAANLPEVREKLKIKGVEIPKDTLFVGGLHDTTKDQIIFYDELKIANSLKDHHQKAKVIFEQSLELNAKERARRFLMLNPKGSSKALHKKVHTRSISLFEPRPELNHATNTLCIVGPRAMSKDLFLDRRAFLNSYEPEIDPEGNVLEKILNAATPVCGGINLEYYFSRVDNQKLGAGTKLPHNVMGLIGVANGVDGDLRPGLPVQMVEVHDPLRLLMVVYHRPEVVLETIQRNASTYEWIKNEWVHLACISPEDQKVYVFRNEMMVEFVPLENFKALPIALGDIVRSRDNLAPGVFVGKVGES